MINEKTGIDVVSFGQGGVGSFGGIWKEPVTQFLYINSVKEYRLPSPRYILVFFYEGNDIYDNIGFLRKKLFSIKKGSLKKNKLNEAAAFLSREFQNVLNGDYGRSLWKNMLFTRSVFQGVLNLVDELFDLNQTGRLFSYPKTPINVALINGKKFSATFNKFFVDVGTWRVVVPKISRKTSLALVWFYRQKSPDFGAKFQEELTAK